jgi:hypothetical protein
VSLLETLIAMIVLAGIVTASTDTSILAARREIQAELDLEAVLFGESLMSRVGIDVPLSDYDQVSDHRNLNLKWSLRTNRISPVLTEVSCNVVISRSGLLATRTFRTVVVNARD